MPLLTVDPAKPNFYHSCTTDLKCFGVHYLLHVPRIVYFHSIIIILYHVQKT